MIAKSSKQRSQAMSKNTLIGLNLLLLAKAYAICCAWEEMKNRPRLVG